MYVIHTLYDLIFIIHRCTPNPPTHPHPHPHYIGSPHIYNKCWLTINAVLWHSTVSNFTAVLMIWICKIIYLKHIVLKLLSHITGVKEPIINYWGSSNKSPFRTIPWRIIISSSATVCGGGNVYATRNRLYVSQAFTLVSIATCQLRLPTYRLMWMSYSIGNGECIRMGSLLVAGK